MLLSNNAQAPAVDRVNNLNNTGAVLEPDTIKIARHH
jgi:hypothetical protein